MGQPRSGIAMSSKHPPGWPPIISGARPRWILWRDIAITLFMWGIFLLIVEAEFAIIWRRSPSLAGTSAYSGLGFGSFREVLRPSVIFIILLVLALGITTLFSRRRRANALLQPQPSPATDEDLAHGLGLSPQQLEALRDQKIIVLDVDALGRTTVVVSGSATPG